MRKETIGGLYLGAGFTLAGSAAAAGKIPSATLGPFTVTALSLAFALPPLLPFMFKGGMPKAGEAVETALLGLFGIVAYRFCLVSALSRIGTAEAGILVGAAPAFTAIASWIFLREKPTVAAIAGVAFACAGVVLVRSGGSGDGGGRGACGFLGEGRPAGAALALGAAASEAVFAVLSRRLFSRKPAADARSRTAWTVAWALLLSVIPALREKPASSLAELGGAGWIGLAWYGVFVTAVSYVCWYEGIRRMEAARSAAYAGIVPLVSLLLPLIMFDERPTAAGTAGCLLLTAGIVAASLPRRNRSAG